MAKSTKQERLEILSSIARHIDADASYAEDHSEQIVSRHKRLLERIRIKNETKRSWLTKCFDTFASARANLEYIWIICPLGGLVFPSSSNEARRYDKCRESFGDTCLTHIGIKPSNQTYLSHALPMIDLRLLMKESKELDAAIKRIIEVCRAKDLKLSILQNQMEYYDSFSSGIQEPTWCGFYSAIAISIDPCHGFAQSKVLDSLKDLMRSAAPRAPVALGDAPTPDVG